MTGTPDGPRYLPHAPRCRTHVQSPKLYAWIETLMRGTAARGVRNVCMTAGPGHPAAEGPTMSCDHAGAVDWRTGIGQGGGGDVWSADARGHARSLRCSVQPSRVTDHVAYRRTVTAARNAR